MGGRTCCHGDGLFAPPPPQPGIQLHPLPASLPLVYCQAVWMNIHELKAADGTVPEFCSSFIVMLETPPLRVHRSNRNTFHHTKVSFSWQRWMCITDCSSYTEHWPWPRHVKSYLSNSHSHDVVIVNQRCTVQFWGEGLNPIQVWFVSLNERNKPNFFCSHDWMNWTYKLTLKDHTICLNMADPATFLVSNSVLATLFFSENSLFTQLWINISFGKYD